MPITFQKSGRSDLTMERGRIVPYTAWDVEVNQENYLTESMNPKVIDYGGVLNIISLQFQYLSYDNYLGTVNGLRTWFESSQINYMENSFTMIDEFGLTHTVRLWQNKIKMDMNAAGRYTIGIDLLEE